MNARDELLVELTAERYSRSVWWHVPPPRQTATEAAVTWDDSEATCARRRRLMAADFATMRDESEVTA